MNILVLHSQPKDFESFLTEATIGHRLHWATCAQDIPTVLRSASPEIVFSIKHSEFPGEHHAQALRWPSVKWFQVGGSGTEHLGQWDSERVQVSNSVGVLAPFHAERAMAALLSMSTGLSTLQKQQAKAIWEPTRFESLEGKTLLILGLGRTGMELAKRAKSFGLKIIGVSRTPREHPMVDEVFSPKELTKLWSQADILSVNVPLNSTTRGMIGQDVLSKLPKHCLLLNASRGGVVDLQALLDALNREDISGAWLDVTDPEPLPPNSPLWHHPRVIITPHCADQVNDFPLRLARFFVQNLRRFEIGEPLLNLLER